MRKSSRNMQVSSKSRDMYPYKRQREETQRGEEKAM